MIPLFFTLIALVAVLSLYLLVEGLMKKVPSCHKVGGTILLVSLFAVWCYFLNWALPLVLIFGIAGCIFASMGTYGEDGTENLKMGLGFCIIGMIFYILSFHFWYQSGWYTSLASTTFILCCLSYINSTQKKHIPALSLLMSIFFMAVTAYVWRTAEVSILLVCIGGGILSLILKACWNVMYKKFF